MEITFEDKIAEALANADIAFKKTMEKYGIDYDDCDDVIYADDNEEKKTYIIRMNYELAPEYGGEE